MAQNVTINGQNYSAVPAVQIPKTGGGTAQFTDVSDTTAVATDVNSGKYIYLANGSKVQGSQNIYSITENLTQVTSNNSSSRILGGSSYVSEITPTDGYLITSVMVTMGGVDITSQVFSGESGSGGGGGITPTGTINISQNGSVDVTNYASANVNVSNSYSSSDEGKVVSNGALVAQGSDTVTQNGTVDTTLINSLTINVPSSSFPEIGTKSTYTLSELFYAISHGTYCTGTVTPTSYYPTGSESLFCDTGFSGTLRGILIFDTEDPSVSGANYSMQQCMGVFTANNSSSSNQTETSRGFWKAGNYSGIKMFGNRMSSYRVNNGKLYIKPAYNTLANSYFMLNHTYRWIAWSQTE